MGALRVAEGDLLHRDFYANYGPGQFYALAGLFHLFGPSVLVERLWDAALRSTIPPLVYLLVARHGAWGPAVAAAFGALLWMATIGYSGYPVFPALAAVLASLLFVLQVFDGRVRHDGPGLVAGGALAGVAALFRYDIGLFLGALEGLMLAAFVAAHTPVADGRLRRAASAFAVFGAGTALVIAPLVAADALFGIIPEFVHQVVAQQAEIYVPMRSLPFPGLQAILHDWRTAVVYLPLATASAAAFAVPVLLRTPTRDSAAGWVGLMAASVTMALFFKGFIRVSTINMAAAIVASLLTTGLLAAWLPRFSPVLRVAVVILATVAAGLTAAQARIAAGQAFRNLVTLGEGKLCHPVPEIERLRCFELDEDHRAAIRLVRQLTSPADRIFVGLGRHDKILLNDISFYFLAGRLPATRWHHMDPGVVTSAGVQRAMVDELVQACTPVIVLETTWDTWREPNGSAESSGVTVLDEFIHTHYRPVATFGDVSVHEAVSAPPGGQAGCVPSASGHS